MRTHYRHGICTSGAALALLVVSGALSGASAQTVITTEPAETRTIVREPLNLSPAQRTTVYRTIIPQGRGKQPIVKERVVTETMGSSAPVRERVVTTPTEVDYVVGDRVPATVELSAFPERIVREVPAMNSYRYMVVNDRILTIDPVTNTVVQVIDR
jgi:hypothetical protein